MNEASMIETPLMRGLERVLDQTAFRHQVLAANLANVDTPGLAAVYRAQARALRERAVLAGSPNEVRAS